VTATQPEQRLLGFTREGVEALSRQKSEPEWLRAARLRAWEIYESLPMPQRTDEEWRRTDLRPLKLDKLTPFATANGHEVDALQLLDRREAVSAGEQDAGVVVQHDASMARAELDPAIAAQGVIFTDLETAARDYLELFQRWFMTEAVPADFGKFEALHAAF
jgi:Fe-S cluster assembly scaffold protein SufB